MPTRLHRWIPLAVAVSITVLAMRATTALAQGCAMCASSFEPNDPATKAFNASILFHPGSLASRAVFPWLRRLDRAALLKWRSFLMPDQMTPAQKRRHRRMSRLRRLWIFN